MIRERHDYEEKKTPLLLPPPLKHADVTVEHELIHGVSATNDHKNTIRTGTLWSTVAHIITAVIGSGVLSLAWSMSQLGWIAGPIALLCFALVTYVSSSLLSDCYRSPDPVTGTRNQTYINAVKVILVTWSTDSTPGEKQARLCGLLQFLNFFGTGVAYVLTTSTCMRAIQKSNCYHKEGHEASCEYSGNLYMLLFGVIQIVMSQIPDFHSMVWVSVVVAVMSFCYSSIGLGLGVAKVIENGRIDGSINGVPAVSLPLKLWLCFQALGDIAFAYPSSIALLEIQDTVKSPPPENKVMKKASVIAIIVTTFFYLGCGCFGYAAFGNDTPGNLVTGFGFYEPYWLIDFVNACIILHLIGGYQLYENYIDDHSSDEDSEEESEEGFDAEREIRKLEKLMGKSSLIEEPARKNRRVTFAGSPTIIPARQRHDKLEEEELNKDLYQAFGSIKVKDDSLEGRVMDKMFKDFNEKFEGNPCTFKGWKKDGIVTFLFHCYDEIHGGKCKNPSTLAEIVKEIKKQVMMDANEPRGIMKKRRSNGRSVSKRRLFLEWMEELMEDLKDHFETSKE